MSCPPPHTFSNNSTTDPTNSRQLAWTHFGVFHFSFWHTRLSSAHGRRPVTCRGVYGGEAASDLQMAQFAMQASAKVFSALTNSNLLNLLPNTFN